MLGALPAIGFLSTGVGMGVGQFAAYGAIAGFSATLTGPPNLSTGGTSSGYDYQGSQVGRTTNYSFLGTNNISSSYPYDFLGQGGSYNLTGHLSNAVWNLNAAPWNDVNYGQLCGCMQASGYGGMQQQQPYAYPVPNYSAQPYTYTLGSVGAQSMPQNCQPVGYDPSSPFPYNNVQYQASEPYPAGYPQQLGTYDASRSFGNGPIVGAVAGYSNLFGSLGVSSQTGSTPFGYCQPAYTNPANYVYPESCQTYPLQSQQTGMYGFGSFTSAYQPYTPPPAPPPPAPSPVYVDGCATDGNGRVLYSSLPPFEQTSSWVDASQIVASRCVGSEANTTTISYSGNDPRVNGDGHADERTTVWWALQQNDRLRYNADSCEFFITYPDGSNRAVDTLSNLLSVRQSSGWDGQVAYKAFGDHLQEVMVTGDLIYPPYQPGASALTTQQFGTQWDRIFPRPNNAALYGYAVPNLPPSTTLIPPNGLG